MPFLLAEILNFQGSTHRIGVGSFSILFCNYSAKLCKIHSLEEPLMLFLFYDCFIFII